MIAINQTERFLGNEVKKGELLAELINETYFHFCNYLKVGKKKRRDGELIPWSVKFINTDQKSVGENILEVRYSDKFIEKYNLKVSPTDPPIFRFYVSKYDSNSYHRLKNPVTRVEINTISDSDTEKSLKDDTKISLYDHWRLLIENDKAIVAKKPKGLFIGDSMINHLFGIVNDKTKSEETKAFKFNQYTDIAQERKKLYKTVGVVAGTVIALKYGKDIAAVNTATEYLCKNSVLFNARQYLIINEDIPPGIKNVPNENSEFRFPSEILHNAINIYNKWLLEHKLPPLYFRKSGAYFEPKEGAYEYSKILADDYIKFMENVFIKKNRWKDENVLEAYFRQRREFFFIQSDNLEFDVLKKNENFKSSPFSFSQENIFDHLHLLYMNPGSPILNRVLQAHNIITDKQMFSIHMNESGLGDQKGPGLLKTLHQEIESIWSWVDDYVSKTKKPMTLDVFLAGLLYRNKGDITGSLMDAIVLTKLAARNDPKTYLFFEFRNPNYHRGLPGTFTMAKHSIDLLSKRLQDPFAPRLSANWVNENSRDDGLFAYNAKSDIDVFDGKDYKPFDRYSAAGNIYHGLGIMALTTVTTPEVIQALILKDILMNNPQINTLGQKQHGLEKNATDLLAAFEIPEVREILDKYEVV